MVIGFVFSVWLLNLTGQKVSNPPYLVAFVQQKVAL
jgi:hypothetical protein